ncbi:hypothetical protein RN001_009948 [Aquatica leii]|uniref:Uncharacterized protein n=1 Tax=Aquatica leii TaxID=1421715 RepID=A0AAN7SE57_9COLE|nr:hypothetical protein RN001_009948 [Aquatica leii]
MLWVLLAITTFTYNIQQTASTCTHENNFGVYFIYCKNLNSLDEINLELYESNPIRVFVRNSSLALKRSRIFKGMFLKELEVTGSNISVIESNFLDTLQQLGTFTIGNSKINKLEPFPELKSLYHVKFFDNDVSHIPENWLEKLSRLYSATLINIKSDLKHLSLNMLKNTPVQYLKIHNVGLETLEPDSLHTLRKLVSLTLSNNNIKNLTNYVFKDLELLEELHLSGNQLSGFDKNVFVGLKKLKELDLSNNKFVNINSTWFEQLPSIHFIDIHSNNIKNVHIAVPSLKTLDLSDNELTELKDGLFTGVPALHFLDVSSNLITHISSDAFKEVYNLEILNLEGNYISKLNGDVYRHFSNLTCLALSYNKITDLSAIEFDHLESLLSLNLSHNNIEKLPKNAFTKLYSLEELDLHKTLLTNIKAEMFYGLKRLQVLNLSGNQLKMIVPGTFKEMPALQVLNIGSVLVSSLKPDTFAGLSNLKMLDLTNNSIVDLPEGLLRYSKFTLISLRRNKIQHLNASIFVNQTEMEELDLRSTRIESLDLVEEMPNLRYLLLKDTKFEKQNIIFFKEVTFRKINEDYWDSWCPEFIPECKRD